jgi:5-methylcytosine-specific restriction protein A
LKRGEKIPIVLWHQNNRYDAILEMTIHAEPRTRMIWRSDFASKIHSIYPQWLEFFKTGEEESEDTPSIQFIKRQEIHQFDVDFLDTSSRRQVGPFLVPLKPNDVVDNDQLRAIFRCSSQGGMRRSRTTNSLVLVSDHTKSTYEDRWIKDVFHYTGMGLTGNQSLTFHQNKTLAKSTTNGVHLFLFEVFEEGKYVYIGEVELAGIPYISQQPDIKKVIRDVYIFPLKVKGTAHPPILRKEILEKKEALAQKRAHKLSLEELEFRTKYVSNETSRREVVSGVYERNPLISEYTKRRANGICQLCNKPAPFNDRYGDPFLETHHIIPLGEGGFDIIENVAALCPNCHRKMHVLQLKSDVAFLQEKSSSKR